MAGHGDRAAMASGDGRYAIPTQATALIGRDEDLDAVRRLLLNPEVRLLTLTGPPGVGKTRLAIAVSESLADRFSGGARFIDLTSVQDANSVLPAIADALGAAGGPGQSTMEGLRGGVEDEDTLLVLDNFEHVIEAGRQLPALLGSFPSLKLLVTSRIAVRLSWEQQYPVSPLRLPDPDCATMEEALSSPSAALFAARARAVQPHVFDGDSNASELVDLCGRLEGLPLAIELAAAQAKVFPLPEITSRLERRLAFLQTPAGDVPHRHSTLRAAIGWSYSLLGPEEQAVFRALGAFAASFGFRAAESICANAARSVEAATRAIGGLVDASLVQSVALPDGRHRLVMLETVREYAAECLSNSGEERATRERHASYYLGLAAEARAEIEGPNQCQCLEHLDADHGNFGLTLRHLAKSGDVSSTAELVDALWRFWWMRGHLALGRQHLSALLAHPELEPGSRARARVLLCSGILAVWQSDYAEAEAALKEAVEIARAESDSRTLAYALTFLCRWARDLGLNDAGLPGFEAVDIQRALCDRWGLGLALHFLGLAVMRAEPAAARFHFEESAAIFRELGTRGDLAMPLRGLGMIAYQAGDFASARRLLEESATYFLERGDEWSAGMVAHDLGYVAYSQGRLDEAADRFQEGLRNWMRLGNRRGQIACVAGLAGVAVGMGKAAEARALLTAVDMMTAATGIALEPTDLATLGEIRAAIRRQAGNEVRSLGPTNLEDAVRRGLEIAEAAASAGSQVDARATTLGAGVLSRRELEVASLVRLGFSNRQIAADLVISEGTAGLHVKHILAKLGFRSRAQVAAWAVEHGLDAPARVVTE
jgi:non-specific serine/threonine protein kinase